MIDSFFKFLLAEKQYSKLTISSYRADIGQFCDFMGSAIESLDFNTVNHKDIRSFIMTLNKEGMSTRSINRKLSSLKTLYRYLNSRGIVNSNPTLKINSLRTEKKLPHFVDKHNITNLVAESVKNSDDFYQERNSTIVILFYTTGIRLSELIDLNIADYNIATNEISVIGKGRKQRLIPLCELTVTKLNHYLSIRERFSMDNFIVSDAIFNNKKGVRVSRSFVYNMINSTLKEIGVDGKCSPHVLRHTFATHLLGVGVGIESVKELLGHASLSTTQIYAHNSIEELIKVRNKFFPEK